METTDITLNRRVLREDIKSHLLNAILRGEYKPGERIIETRLASQLGVSQAPVREALRDLTVLGMIESSPYKGASVRQFTMEELGEIYPVRAALEGIAGRTAVHRLTAADFATLEQITEAMLTSADKGDAQLQARQNIEFHRLIVEASHNQTLIQIWGSFQFATWTFVTMARTAHNLHELAMRHYAVIEALRSGDPAQAEVALRKHIEEAGDWIQPEPKS